ncbi:DUF1330 domain-containing protein [Thaumasiovibrio subtropicus]|uniref:DUF1330 domain-containing protein n=1 Tax=Thaumasiovibrio subtropicus TaxID=1891207 RepID=UPI000B357288|nr:DUF1330 domain-containing protein [Thaumasiovibrio subtropicus]
MYEMLIAMEIKDEQGYGRYREAMLPILRQYGGGFRYDFKVAETLTSASTHPVQRVFAIYFASEEKRDAFFASESYLAVKETHFQGSAGDYTCIAEYTVA